VSGTGCTVTVGRLLTVINIDAVLVQPAGVVTVTLYVVVFIGEAATGLVVVELNPAAGLHKKVYPAGNGPPPITDVPISEKTRLRFTPPPTKQPVDP
jgi:hypothetical protein